MLLTLTTDQQPATDLGFLLHKHPDRPQSLDLSFGVAHIFYPEASAERCTVALLLDVDPIRLVRGAGATLSQYVNDRPYAASSLLAVALGRAFRTAMRGDSKDRPELAAAALPLEIRIAALPVRGGASLLARLFEPLGYEVESTGHPLDPAFPAWGDSVYHDVTLRTTGRLADVLTHLYVLIPVLDDDKHYWVGDDEIEKLLDRGSDWLPEHPERDLIAHRYLKRQRHLTRLALSRLVEDEASAPDERVAKQGEQERALERPIRLNDLRIKRVADVLRALGARSVVDLGCGEGRLLRELLKDSRFERIVGVDVSQRALDIAARRLRLDEIPPRQRERIELMQGALTYRDPRLEGFDAAALIEVIEHVDPPRVAAVTRGVFGYARPSTVIVTTPNREYNVHFERLTKGKLRHGDHRFEWTRAEFQEWAERIAGAYGYRVAFEGIGDDHDDTGAPTQMGVFGRVR